jgi:hypothetical protein
MDPKRELQVQRKREARIAKLVTNQRAALHDAAPPYQLKSFGTTRSAYRNKAVPEQIVVKAILSSVEKIFELEAAMPVIL